MARSVSGLCAFLNDVLGLEAGTAEAYANKLRAADLVSRSVGGRGIRGGAEATSGDAATLLLALTASNTAAGAVDAVKHFGSFAFAGVVGRIVTAHQDMSFGIDLTPEIAPARVLFKQSYISMLRASIEAARAGIADPPGTVATDIGVHGSGEDAYGWFSMRLDAPIDGAAHFVSALWTPKGRSVDAARFSKLAKMAVVPFTLISELADFLGPLPLETACADGALIQAAN